MAASMPIIKIQREDDSDSRFWGYVDGERFCFIIGANKVFMAERNGRSFGPFKSKRAAVLGTMDEMHQEDDAA